MKRSSLKLPVPADWVPPSGMSREICKACWSIVAVGFSVPDEVWERAVPEPLRERVLCLNCFTRLADERFVEWDLEIEFWPVSLVSHLFARE